jgi:Flp pilus assembly protein TadG
MLRIKAKVARRADRSCRGTTALEFALLAPALFLFLFGISELSLVMVTRHLMENAVFNASRLAKTGYVDDEKTQLETVESKLLSELSGLSPLLDVSKVTMTTTSYGSLSTVGETSEGTTGLGTAQEILVLSISYPWTFFTPLIGNLMGDENQQVTLTSRIVVRNEPYD